MKLERLSDILTAIALCDNAGDRMAMVERVRELVRDYDILDVVMPKAPEKKSEGCACRLCASQREYMERVKVNI